MNFRGVFTCIAIAAALAGCKIELSTTPGGRIVTQSGHYDCRASSTCPIIEVTDTNFDEVFRAVPDPGFYFAGWRKRTRSFCGNRRLACSLGTTDFGGNSNLLAILASDQTYYLEAVFLPNNFGEGSGVGNAAECFRESANGTVIRGTLRYSPREGDSFDGDFEQKYEMGQRFNGRNAVRWGTKYFTGRTENYDSIVYEYLAPPQFPRREKLGEEVVPRGEGTPRSTRTFDPFELRRADMDAGDSFHQSYTITQESTNNGGTTTDTVDIEATINFDGIERITVPAGSFQACRFRTVTTSEFRERGTSLTGALIEWVAVGDSILLKAVSVDQIVDLVAASINGSEI